MGHRQVIGCVRIKDGIELGNPSPAGVRILAALEAVARSLNYDMLINCGRGEHPPTDPHSLGNAYDIRSKTLGPDMKDQVLRLLLLDLCEHAETLQQVSIGFATTLFYAQLEDRGGDNEHIHVQLRNGRTYPPMLKTSDPKVTTV